MFLDYPTTWEVMKISDLQQQLFDPGEFDRHDYTNIDSSPGDWNRDVNGDFSPLNKLINGTLRNPPPPGSQFGGHRVFGMPPKLEAHTMPPKLEFGGHQVTDRLEPIDRSNLEISIASPRPPTEMPPKLGIGGHDLADQTEDKRSRVKVKGINYLLTRSKSTKYMPPNKGWFEIKVRGKNLFLYLRWWDEKVKRSRCLGKVDRVE